MPLESVQDIEPLPSGCLHALCLCIQLHALASAGSCLLYTNRIMLCRQRLQTAADTVVPAAAQHASQAITAIDEKARANKKQADTATGAQIRRHTDALRWLCRKAGRAAVAAPSLASPHTKVVTMLLNKGVRVSLEHLVSGALTHAHSSSTAVLHTLVVTCSCELRQRLSLHPKQLQSK